MDISFIFGVVDPDPGHSRVPAYVAVAPEGHAHSAQAGGMTLPPAGGAGIVIGGAGPVPLTPGPYSFRTSIMAISLRASDMTSTQEASPSSHIRVSRNTLQQQHTGIENTRFRRFSL